ncbi:MAG TPA: SPFH domain-containing protein [Anaerolineales bacterium]|nr:SPFH domain-containing protein [Anaerolineales bacterium]
MLLSGGQKMTVHDLVRILARTLDVIWQALQRLKNWKYVKDEKGKYFITIEGIEYLALKGISASEPDDDPAPKDFIKKIRPPFFSSWSELALWAAMPLFLLTLAAIIIPSITWGYNYVSFWKTSYQILVAIACVALIGLYIRMSYHKVMEHERLVVFRGGKAIAKKGPGHVFLLPLVDNPKKVDLREKSKEINKEPCITRDNLLVHAGFYISWQIDDPIPSLTKVSNVEDSVLLLSTAILKAALSEYNLNDALQMRKAINNLIRTRIEQKIGDWGIKVNNTEIREIQPPEDIMKAMQNQLTATLESQTTLAQTDAQVEALRRLFAIGSQLDDRTFSLKYLETLTRIGEGPSTKFIFPMEFFRLLEDFIKSQTNHKGNYPAGGNANSPAGQLPSAGTSSQP